MSLISSASPWTNDNTSRKRVSSMQKTVKLRPYMRDEEERIQTEFIPSENNRGEYKIQSIEDVQTVNDVRVDRVSEIIEKMTNIDDSDNSGMADFSPLSNPEINHRKPELNYNVGGKADTKIPNPSNELQIPVPMVNGDANSNNPFSNYTNGALGSYSNYHTTYDNSKMAMSKQYSRELACIVGVDNKIMEKLNYMVHLLENQENEKTANVTEELILYTFLGVFIIFVLDSFARSGKYVR